MSNSTAATQNETTSTSACLILAFELGEESWLLGFSTGLGQEVLRRKIPSRCRTSLQRAIEWARGEFGLGSEVQVISGYEAGRDGFWLHRYLEAEGFRNFVMDSASIEVNRRKGLLPQLERLRLWNGESLPLHLRERLEHYAEDFAYHSERIRWLEQKRRELMRARATETMEKVWRLFSLRGVGIESAWIYGTEFYGWRKFCNGKQVGSLAGLTPTPFDSGTKEREQGIGKDGSRWVRGVAIEQAWAWLRLQPDSELAKWYERRFGHGSKRLRKIGIVALARKLLIALWHWVEHGVLPEGAVLKTDLRLA